MVELRDLFAELGFTAARTVLQSGSVVFKGGRQSGAALERRLQVETENRLAIHTDYFVRTAEDWASVVARNPFPDEALRDPGHLTAVFLKKAPAAGAVAALQAAITGPEVVRAPGRHAYVFYPAGIGRSKLTNTLIEDKLGCSATGRNWNTVMRLAALIQSPTPR